MKKSLAPNSTDFPHRIVVNVYHDREPSETDLQEQQIVLNVIYPETQNQITFSPQTQLLTGNRTDGSASTQTPNRDAIPATNSGVDFNSLGLERSIAPPTVDRSPPHNKKVTDTESSVRARRITARELHKYVWGMVGVFLLAGVTFPIAMWRVSQSEKFSPYQSHLKPVDWSYQSIDGSK
jgi:hypothetical protein